MHYNTNICLKFIVVVITVVVIIILHVSLPTTNIVNDSLTPCTHIAKITATVNQRDNLIVRNFTSRDISMLLHAYIKY